MRTSFSPWRKRSWARLLLSTQPRYPVPLSSCSSFLPSFHDSAHTLNSGFCLSACTPLIPLPVKCPPPLESRTLVAWLRCENGEHRSWLKALGNTETKFKTPEIPSLVPSAMCCMLSHSVVSDSSWPQNCSLLVSSVHEISQARTLEWVAISFSRGSPWPRDQTHVSCVSCIGRRILYHWTMWKALLIPQKSKKIFVWILMNKTDSVL